jgi:hypothetical protein
LDCDSRARIRFNVSTFGAIPDNDLLKHFTQSTGLSSSTHIPSYLAKDAKTFFHNFRSWRPASSQAPASAAAALPQAPAPATAALPQEPASGTAAPPKAAPPKALASGTAAPPSEAPPPKEIIVKAPEHRDQSCMCSCLVGRACLASI